MTDAVAELFNFSKRPLATQVRHMWTSVTNLVFPSDSNKSIYVSANDQAAELCGHSASTHRQHYQTQLYNGIELIYRKYQCVIGYPETPDNRRQMEQILLLQRQRQQQQQQRQYLHQPRDQPQSPVITNNGSIIQGETTCYQPPLLSLPPRQSQSSSKSSPLLLPNLAEVTTMKHDSTGQGEHEDHTDNDFVCGEEVDNEVGKHVENDNNNNNDKSKSNSNNNCNKTTVVKYRDNRQDGQVNHANHNIGNCVDNFGNSHAQLSTNNININNNQDNNWSDNATTTGLHDAACRVNRDNNVAVLPVLHIDNINFKTANVNVNVNSDNCNTAAGGGSEGSVVVVNKYRQLPNIKNRNSNQGRHNNNSEKNINNAENENVTVARGHRNSGVPNQAAEVPASSIRKGNDTKSCSLFLPTAIGPFVGKTPAVSVLNTDASSFSGRGKATNDSNDSTKKNTNTNNNTTANGHAQQQQQPQPFHYNDGNSDEDMFGGPLDCDFEDNYNQLLTLRALLPALRAVLRSPDADFRNEAQRDMCTAAALPSNTHTLVGMPCGQGKSFAWVVPVAAAVSLGKELGVMIVVVPYNYLLHHLEEASRQALRNINSNVRVTSLRLEQCAQAQCPSALLEDNNHELPQLIFMSLDALASVMDQYIVHLRMLSRKGKIHRFFIDEVHTIYGETFRESYEKLRNIATLGVPVMCLSGSLPLTLASSLCRYLNLSFAAGTDSGHNTTDTNTNAAVNIDLIYPRYECLVGLFPPGFNIHCTTIRGGLSHAAKLRIVQVCKARDGTIGSRHANVNPTDTAQIMGGNSRKAKVGVHVICSSIALTEELQSMLSVSLGAVSASDRITTPLINATAVVITGRDQRVIAVVTSKTETDVQVHIAQQWRSGLIDILISTTCALVGKEEPAL